MHISCYKKKMVMHVQFLGLNRNKNNLKREIIKKLRNVACVLLKMIKILSLFLVMNMMSLNEFSGLSKNFSSLFLVNLKVKWLLQEVLRAMCRTSANILMNWTTGI